MPKSETNPQSTVSLEDLEFEETPTSVILEAIQKYEQAQQELQPADDFSAEETWNFLAHQVVGHETRH